MASSLYIELKKENPNADMRSVEAFQIDKKIYVQSKFVEMFFDITRQTHIAWQHKGLTPDEKSIKRKRGVKIYELDYLIKWQNDNVDHRRSKNAKKVHGQPAEPKPIYPKADIKDVTREEAERLLKIENVKIERLKHDELAKELIRAEDTDRAMAELGAIHVAQYQGDLKLLPILLEGKTKQEIAELLDDHYKARVEDMNKIVNKKPLKRGKTLFNAMIDFIKGD